MRRRITASILAIIWCICGIGCSGVLNSRPDTEFSAAGWQEFRNDRQGFHLLVPPELEVRFEKQNDREWAAQNMMPFDYVNFKPRRPRLSGDSVFELGIGVHANRAGLGTRAFADRKDDGLKSAGARIEIVSQTNVTVAGIPGVRDDFRLQQPYGRRCYSRIIVPSEDRFIVFLCTTGADRPVLQYERTLDRILKSFSVTARNP